MKRRLPRLAQMRNANRVQKCLLFGVDRTYRRQVLNDANDPHRTCASLNGVISSLTGQQLSGRRAASLAILPAQQPVTRNSAENDHGDRRQDVPGHDKQWRIIEAMEGIERCTGGSG